MANKKRGTVHAIIVRGAFGAWHARVAGVKCPECGHGIVEGVAHVHGQTPVILALTV